MSRKWLNPPLTLVSATTSDERSENLAGHAGPSGAGLLRPANAGNDFHSRRESGLSETQYAIAGLPNSYTDLPSAVPFQDAFTPALPSAEFPSSVRGFASPPGTSSTSDFPSASLHHATYQPSIPPENKRLSNPSIHSDYTVRDPTIISGAPGATALNRADSSVSYNSVWSGEGSNQHLALDITQFPRPPDSPSDDVSSPPTSTVPTSFHPLRRITKLRPPASPLYEESEPSASRPSTPGTVSYRYPLNASDSNLRPTSIQSTDALSDTRNASIPVASLIPPSPDPSARASFQSHLTAASRGSSVPRLSMNEDSARTSAQVDSNPAWDHVMNTINPHWNSSNSNVNEHSSTTPSTTSAAAVVGTSTIGHGDRNILLVPPKSSSVTAQSPMSMESNSDVYSAISRMSFPKPPSGRNSGIEERSPISPGARSPWVTGVTLKTRNSRGSLGSLRRSESLKRSAETSPIVPAVPPLPLSGADFNPPSSARFQGSPDEESPIERPEEAAYASSGKESRLDSPRLLVPNESRESNISGISDRAPSYDRRVSELLKATNEPPKRGSMASVDTAITTSSPHSSVDGAVVGVARTASLSARAKALLTRGPSLKRLSQDLTLPYLVPSPLPSAQISDTSLPGTPSIQITSPRRFDDDIDDDLVHRRPPRIQEPGTFPESVGSSQSIGDGEEGISLHRIQSHDAPHSAFPLNQSTPFQNYFPASSHIPTSYRAPNSSTPLPPVVTLSRSGSKASKSKSRRSSVLSSLTRAPSRLAKSISWFRRKPLPELPPSPTREKHEKPLPHPDDEMSIPDLAIRAAVMHQYLDVGELPYKSPLPSPHLAPDARGYMHGVPNAPRLSVQSVISTLSERARAERRRVVGFAQLPEHGLEANAGHSDSPTLSVTQRRRALWFIVVLVIMLAITIPIGVIFGRKAVHSATAVVTCTGGVMTGASCQLNSTCVCTSSNPGQCDPVAQALLDLIPPSNDLFGMNMTANSLALALWDLQGQPPASNCANQAVLVDVAPALNETTSPNRTQFARTAVLYNLIRTYDLTSTATLRSFVASTDFSSMHGQDGPVTDDSLSISAQSAGFVYDFAAMTVAPTSIEWTGNSGVSQQQIQRVGFFADRALDRMYSFATASSIQRSTALNRYWTGVLHLPENDIPKFISALSSAPVILPFDTASSEIISFFANTTTNQGISLPAPVSCLPSIPQQGRDNIDIIEQTAFGLSALTTPATLDAACFPDRPLYGVLDVLRLRRAFGDGRSSMRIPTAELIADAAPRVVLHSGEQLVGLTGVDDAGRAMQGNFTTVDADPREYGTLQHLNHVALSWLQAFPNLTLAVEAAQFVLSVNDNSQPPESGNPLFDQTDDLSAFPVIEVSVFGSILPTDVETFRADFGGPNGSLFFGSKSGDIFRHWALRDDGDVILWSNSTTAPQVVQEHAANNTAFETIWAQATGLINAAAAVGRGTGAPEIRTIVSALSEAQLFQ